MKFFINIKINKNYFGFKFNIIQRSNNLKTFQLYFFKSIGFKEDTCILHDILPPSFNIFL